jgi:D-alanyl-D-alanine dipeptidase
MTLVEIFPPGFDVDLEIAYATPHNFTGAPVYRRAACFLHPDAADALQRAIKLAGALGLRLKVFDGYRPAEAQWVLWHHTPDPEFLADPRHGSAHSRGVAADLTLLDHTGQELDMGTGFDAFTPLAHHGTHRGAGRGPVQPAPPARADDGGWNAISSFSSAAVPAWPWPICAPMPWQKSSSDNRRARVAEQRRVHNAQHDA